jgi:uncharacterized protein (TIGR02266 family)
MSVKTILVAHQSPAVRERFTAAVAEARHAAIQAGSAADVESALARSSATIDLALVDLGLTPAPMDLVARVRRGGRRLIPVVVFAGSMSSADQVLALASLGVTSFVNEHAASAQILPALVPHLFPDNFNRRANARVPAALPVSYRSASAISAARTQDVSRGGVAIRTMDPLPIGTEIDLTFRLPGSKKDINASGRVAWSDRRVGMGVQFDRLTSDALQALSSFVDGGR